MIPYARKLLCLVPAALLFAAAPVWADATLDTAERLLGKALRETKDTPLNKGVNAGNVITALRMANDKDLLPFFEKLRQSTSKENQIYGMVASAILTKDAKKIDLPLLFSSEDMAFVGSAIASLIDNEVLNVTQLETISTTAPRKVHRAMGVGELSRRKALADRTLLTRLLTSSDDVVRYYAAVTVLEAKDSPDGGGAAEALSLLQKMSEKHDLRQAAVQATMIVRIQKEKITAGCPWVVSIAKDEANDEGLRFTAISALLTLQQPEGATILAEMIKKPNETAQQVKLGLIALEGAGGATGLKAAMLEPLKQSKVALVKDIAKLAQQGADGGDITPGLLELIQRGHPIILDWALAYSERADSSRKLELRRAIINQSNIVDEARGRDYERDAARAAQRVLEDNGGGGGDEGRKLIASLVKSDNRAIVESCLAGTFRSTVANQSEIVLPVWDALSKSTTQETSANYAALILAREGHAEPKTWLSGMVLGGTVQNTGFRGLAGWYYAKLLGQGPQLLKKVLAD